MFAVPFREISVFEPDLRTVGSHHFEYVQILREAAADAGLAVRVFGHRDLHPEVRRLTGADPLFTDIVAWQARVAAGWPFRRLPWAAALLATWRQNRLATRELSQAFRALDWENQLILVPNCHQGINLALARCLRAPLRRHPTAGAVLVFPYYPSRHLFLRTFRPLVPLVRAGCLALATDSEPLGELYRTLTGLRFTVLPMPYGTGAGDGDAPPPRAAAATGALFLVCGGYRMEKGIDLLADLIENQESDIAAGALSFVLQGFANETSPDPLAAGHFARIRAVAARCPAGSITLIGSVLSSREYHALFQQCDAAILPYRSGPYGIRTSGVLTECVARGLPVVATDDTWLGYQVRTRGAGLTFPDGDVPALVRAVRRIAAELPRFAAAGQQAQSGWTAFHNPQNYLRMVGELAGHGLGPVGS